VTVTGGVTASGMNSSGAIGLAIDTEGSVAIYGDAATGGGWGLSVDGGIFIGHVKDITGTTAHVEGSYDRVTVKYETPVSGIGEGTVLAPGTGVTVSWELFDFGIPGSVVELPKPGLTYGTILLWINDGSSQSSSNSTPPDDPEPEYTYDDDNGDTGKLCRQLSRHIVC